MSNKRAFCNEEIFRNVSEELGLSVKEVREIFNSQSAFTKKVMESNTFDEIRWCYFGAFKIKPKKIQIAAHMQGLNSEAKKRFKQQLKNGEIYNKK